MTDKEKQLWFKYNLINTRNYVKNNELNKQLYYNKINRNNNQFKNSRQWLILLHGTYNCNANCIYCENHKLREKYQNKIIDKTIIEQIVYKLGNNIREITWHGGESLLLPEEYFELLYNLKNKLNLDFTISLQTNAILYDKNKENLLKQYNFRIGSSFDGLLNTNNRGILSTTSVLQVLERQKNYKNQIGVIMVITKESINNLIENYQYMKSLGFKNIQTAIVRENVIEDTNPYLINNNIAIPAILEYYKYWIYDINNPLFDSYLARQTERILGNPTMCEDTNCIGGWLVIDPLGNISTCGMDPETNNFGNIQEINNYQDILSNPKYLKCIMQQQQLINTQCSNCDILSICYGGCMGNNYETDHNYSKLNLRVCNFNKLLINGLCEILLNLDMTDLTIYNPYFLEILQKNNYYSLNEIKKIEEELSNA